MGALSQDRDDIDSFLFRREERERDKLPLVLWYLYVTIMCFSFISFEVRAIGIEMGF
jgi:hypothetical protein